MNRLFSMESKVDSQSLRTGNLKDEEWSKLIESAGIIGESNLIIDDTPVSPLLRCAPNAGNTSWNMDWISSSSTICS